jgi:hypothetical protein
VVGLFIAGSVGAVLVIYAADRILKARAQVRRLSRMSDRLAAATAKAEEQHEQRQATERASAALTTYIPAIKRPPVTRPGAPAPRTPRQKAGRERPGAQDRESASHDRRPSRAGQRRRGR